MLKPSEADCLPGSDFLEDNHCDALFSSMQIRFPNSQRVPPLHSRKASSHPFTEQVNVIERETTFILAGHEAVSFPEKSADEQNDPTSSVFDDQHAQTKRKSSFGHTFTSSPTFASNNMEKGNEHNLDKNG